MHPDPIILVVSFIMIFPYFIRGILCFINGQLPVNKYGRILINENNKSIHYITGLSCKILGISIITGTIMIMYALINFYFSTSSENIGFGALFVLGGFIALLPTKYYYLFFEK